MVNIFSASSLCISRARAGLGKDWCPRPRHVLEERQLQLRLRVSQSGRDKEEFCVKMLNGPQFVGRE